MSHHFRGDLKWGGPRVENIKLAFQGQKSIQNILGLALVHSTVGKSNQKHLPRKVYVSIDHVHLQGEKTQAILVKEFGKTRVGFCKQVNINIIIRFDHLTQDLYCHQSSIKCGVSSQRNLCHFFGS